MRNWCENISASIKIESIVQTEINNRNVKRVFYKEERQSPIECYYKRYLNPIQSIDFLVIEEQILYFYGWQEEKFNNHDMALLLIDILHSQGIVNNATYKKIMKNQKCCLN